MSPTARALRLVAATAAVQTLAAVACAGSVRGLAGCLPTLTAAGPAPGDPVRVVAAVQAVAWLGVALCCLWFAASVLACARDLARHPARPVPRSALGCLRPAFVRSLLVVLAGGCLAQPVVQPVTHHIARLADQPADPPAAERGPAHRAGWALLDGLPLPGLPTGHAPAPHPRTVEVRPGDCLWTLTEALLGPQASDAQVARAWPLLRRANLAVLGPDPDLVRPGTTLRVPVSLQHRPGAPR